MRSRPNHTISVRAVHAHAATLIEDHLQIRDHSPKCRTAVRTVGRVAPVVEHGQRFTLAMSWVGKNEPLKEILQRLLKQVHSPGIKIRFVLLDRAFHWHWGWLKNGSKERQCVQIGNTCGF